MKFLAKALNVLKWGFFGLSLLCAAAVVVEILKSIATLAIFGGIAYAIWRTREAL